MPIVSSTFRKDGILFAYANTYGVIKVVDTVRKNQIAKASKHHRAAYSLDFARNSALLVSGSDDKVKKIIIKRLFKFLIILLIEFLLSYPKLIKDS